MERKIKIYSLFYIENLSSDYATSDIIALDSAVRKKLSEINTVNFEATKHALIERQLPVRSISLKDLSARSVGVLVAYSMLEIITLCNMMKVNPFDQPGVELIKRESKRLVH